ncbi:MAG: preprotein translocase subunit YajC [Alphaproteobacteria bacterium]
MISQAFAQGSSLFGGLESLSSFLPLVLIFVVFYFFLIRPQQKKAQQHREMIGALRRGDRIVTNGGLVGTVVRVVDEREVELEVAPGVQVRVIRGMVADVMAKTQPPQSKAVEDSSGKGEASAKKNGALEQAGGTGVVSGDIKDAKKAAPKPPAKNLKKTTKSK